MATVEVPPFLPFLEAAAKAKGVEKALSDHEINSLYPSRPVEQLQMVPQMAATLDPKAYPGYLDHMDQIARALAIVADAAARYAEAVRKAFGVETPAHD